MDPKKLFSTKKPSLNGFLTHDLFENIPHPRPNCNFSGGAAASQFASLLVDSKTQHQ